MAVAVYLAPFLAALKVVQMESSLFINQVKMLLARIDIKNVGHSDSRIF